MKTFTESLLTFKVTAKMHVSLFVLIKTNKKEYERIRGVRKRLKNHWFEMNTKNEIKTVDVLTAKIFFFDCFGYYLLLPN